MTKYEIIRKQYIDISPKECAFSFASMDSNDQATFFNEVADYVELNYKQQLCFQFQYVTDSPLLTKEGREVMTEIGNYAERNK